MRKALYGPGANAESGVVSPEVVALTERMQVVTEAVTIEDVFNHYAAELLLRNLAGMFNGFQLLDTATFGRLHDVDQTRLSDMATRAYQVLGFAAQESARLTVEAFAPRNETEVRLALCRNAFNSLQQAVFIGPDRISGYPSVQEPTIRELVREGGQVFATTYLALDAMGHPLAADPDQRRYFEANIQAATPACLQAPVEMPDLGFTGPVDEIW